MKFGKQLKEQSVGAWDEYYMSYKRLKRIIKKLVLQIKEKEEQLMRQRNANISKNGQSSQNGYDAGDAASEATHLLMTGDARKEFNAVLDNDIDKVNSFFLSKLDEIR